MNTDRTTEAIVEAWLSDGFTVQPDAERMLLNVRAGVAGTSQRHHRWWPFGRTAHMPVPATNGPTPARGFTMFSAVKFIAAGVIVALFGGFLLATGLTTPQGDQMAPAAVTASPSPMTTEELLSGMVTEEVEPGVFRVINDGVRDIASVRYRDVVAGHDGSIWLSGAGSRQDIVRLGSPRDRALKWPDDTEAMGITVTQDGTVWRRYWLTEGGPRLDSFEDGKWTKHHRRIDLDIESLTIAPDGTLWAGPEEGGGLVVSRLEADGWEPLSAPAPTDGELLVTPSGEVWVAGALPGVFSQDDGSWQEEEPGRMWRYRWVDGEWQGQAVEMDAMPVDPFTLGLGTGTDGTVWFAGLEGRMADGEPVLDADGNPVGDSFLMRYDGTEWQRWGPADGVPPFEVGSGVGLRQAPDGGLWIKAPDHIARFDGTEWQRFMSGRYPSHWYLAWDVAPDGSVWLNALDDRDDDTKSDLYVITPEAVVATE